MNLTRYIYRTSHIGLSFLETNFKFFEKKTLITTRNITLNFHKTYSKSGLVSESNIFPKKRLVKKKKLLSSEKEGYRILAFSTAEEYNLENLSLALPGFTAFKPTTFGSEFARSHGSVAINKIYNDELYLIYYKFIKIYETMMGIPSVGSVDVIHATNDEVGVEPVCQDLFFFRDGCVVMWNVSDSDVVKVLDLLKIYENRSFNDDLIKSESEAMNYSESEDISQTKILQDSLILSTRGDIHLEKYAISNAMALSVHLGTYEASLEQYIHTMEPVTEDLKTGHKIKMSRNEVLQKTGQLFALRHNINLNSDLLDTPDFYWDREELENLYQTVFNYFCISKRTRVINEKINHCIELVELLSSHLNDKHHIRLEWMIIILIMIEVAFEVCHYLDRYVEAHEK